MFNFSWKEGPKLEEGGWRVKKEEEKEVNILGAGVI